MNDVSIRRGTIADAEKIAEVYVRSSRAVQRGHVPDAELDVITSGDYLGSWHRRLGSPVPHATWVAEVDGEVVGFCYVEPSPDDDATAATGHVDMLYVLPERAGRGIGAWLLAEGVTHLRRFGFSEATLWALVRNQRTRRFYEREGWTASVHKLYEHDGHMVDVIRYGRPLVLQD